MLSWLKSFAVSTAWLFRTPCKDFGRLTVISSGRVTVICVDILGDSMKEHAPHDCGNAVVIRLSKTGRGCAYPEGTTSITTHPIADNNPNALRYHKVVIKLPLPSLDLITGRSGPPTLAERGPHARG